MNAENEKESDMMFHNTVESERFEELDKMRRNFSLIELLIVILVIAVIVSLLLPMLKSARNKAQAVFCINGMSQIGKASLSMYSADYDGWVMTPVMTSAESGLGGFASWIHLANHYLNSRKGESKSVLNEKSLFRCPADKSPMVTYSPSNSDTAYIDHLKFSYQWHQMARCVSVNDYGRLPKFRLMKIRNPTSRSVITEGGNSIYNMPSVSIIPMISYGMMRMRHDSRANIVFFDSHAASASYNTLIYNPENPSVYRYTSQDLETY